MSAGPADSLSILYLGPDSGTCRHRAQALGRLGHKVHLVDPTRILRSNLALNWWIHHSGARFVEGVVSRNVLESLPDRKFDLTWVDGGHLVGPGLISELKHRSTAVINYNVDDPFGGRDGLKWRLYNRALPLYDLVVVVRESNVAEAYAAGSRDVLVVYRSADEVAHVPKEITDADRARWESDVLFLGTWMPERGPFLARLVELGVRLSIFGDRWAKAKEWPVLRAHWRGPGIWDDEPYAKVIQCAKVCLGLLSKGNRDLSTQRTFEIPYIGGLLCAERTVEHAALYEEDLEAVFWSTPEECAEKCLMLSGDERRRIEIASRGRQRCLRNRTTNEAILTRILEAATKNQSQPVGSLP
jgi:spore maturation protein CgeB